MADNPVGINMLYAGFNRSMVLLGLFVLAVWLFAALSFYLSKATGVDWFSRSGSLMALSGAVASFRAVNVYQNKLASALREGLVSVAREIELTLEPPRPFRLVLYFGYLTGIVGTAIWGYGDILLR
jgi:hypothetical protein